MHITSKESIGIGPDPRRAREAPSVPPASRSMSTHVYARRAALSIEPDENRRGEATASFEFAHSNGAGGYTFDAKVSFQLSRGELAEVAAAFLEPGVALTLTHRSSALKTLTVHYRAPHVRVELRVGADSWLVPICPADQHYVRTWLVTRLAAVQQAPMQAVLASLTVLAAQLRLRAASSD
jgi:hypothetical protein